jgi:hypothetical protein
MFSFVAREAAEKLAPRLLESGAERIATSAVGRAAGRAVSSEVGQRVIGRVAGSRAAEFAGSESGQKWAGRIASREAKKIVQGDQTPRPQTVYSNPDWERDSTNANLLGTTAINHAQLAMARRSTHYGFGGTGKGWWNLNEQTSMAQGTSADWRQIGDYGVTRGPAINALPGRGLASSAGAAGGHLGRGLLGALTGGISYGVDGPVGSDGQGRVFPQPAKNPVGDVPSVGPTSVSGIPNPREDQLENVTTRAYGVPISGAIGQGGRSTQKQRFGPYPGTSRTQAFGTGASGAVGTGPRALNRGTVIDTHTIEEDQNGQMRWGF